MTPSRKISILRMLLFPVLVIFIAVLNSYIKNYWLTGLMAWIGLMLLFIFYFPSFRISLAMSRAIKRKAYQKAIDMGEKAITQGETSFAIKVNLMAAYYHNNDMLNAKRLLAVIEGNKMSVSEKKIFETWKQKLSESKMQNN